MRLRSDSAVESLENTNDDHQSSTLQLYSPKEKQKMHVPERALYVKELVFFFLLMCVVNAGDPRRAPGLNPDV